MFIHKIIAVRFISLSFSELSDLFSKSYLDDDEGRNVMTMMVMVAAKQQLYVVEEKNVPSSYLCTT